MFEVNDDFEVDADFLDEVFASEQEALGKQTVPIIKQLPECQFKQPSSNSIFNKSCLNSIHRPPNLNSENLSFPLNNLGTTVCQNDRDRNPLSHLSNQDNTPKRCITSTRNAVPSKIKRQRKFPGPAGLLSETNYNNSLAVSTYDLDADDSLDKIKKDKLCSQSTLSGSALEEEPWQSFLSELGSQQEILKILNIENIKKRAAARLLAKKRVPFLAAVLHYINPSTPDPCIILRDTTGHEGIPSIEEADRFTKKYAEADFVGPELFFGVPRSMMYLHNIIEAWEQGEIHGILQRNVLDEFGSELKPGCVLVLRNISVFSTGFASHKHYLNITGKNLVTLYTPSQGKVQASGGVNVTNLNFLNFIEDWRTSVNPVISPSNFNLPYNALSLFNTSLPQSLNSPEVRCVSPKIISGGNIPQIRNTVPRFSSVNNPQARCIGPRFVSRPNSQQLQTTIPSVSSPLMRNIDSNNIKVSTANRGIFHNSSGQQLLGFQNTISQNTTNSIVQNKTSVNCNQQYFRMPVFNLNLPSTQTEHKPRYTNNFVPGTIKNNTTNKIKFSDGDFLCKQSQDLFSSSDLSSVTTHKHQFSNNTIQEKIESDVNFLDPFSGVQPKKPKMCTTNTNSSFKEINRSENIFSLRNRPNNLWEHTGENTNTDRFSVTIQSPLVFTRDQEDNEKSIVESMFDGFDSEAFFDDF